MVHQVDVVVLGAGASGLMLAAEAGKRGRSVVVLEKANKVGKKILMSGILILSMLQRPAVPKELSIKYLLIPSG